MLESALKKIGLTDKEIAVYFNILKLGSGPVRKIAEQAQINRTTVHDILNKLIEYGLVSFVDKEKHRYFTVESPEHLLNRVETKKNELEQARQDITAVLPELKSLYEKSESRPKAKYFEGETGLRGILQDVLNCMGRQAGDRKYFVYSSSAIRDTLYRVFPNYNQERIKLGIAVQSISIGEGGLLHGLDERKWLSRGQSSPTYTLIYADKIALVSLDENKKPLGVIVQDSNTYKTQVMIFQALWQKI